MLGNFSEVNSKRTVHVSKIRKRKRKLLSCVHILYKTWNQTVSRCSCEKTAKKCTKTQSVVHVQGRCFANLNLTYCFFCRSCCRPRRRCLSSLTLQTLWRQRPTEHFHLRHFPRPCFNIGSYQSQVLSLIPPQETQEISLCINDDVTDENITENTEKKNKLCQENNSFTTLNNQCQELRSTQISINIIH